MKLKKCPFCGATVNANNQFGFLAGHEPDCFFVYLDKYKMDICEDEILQELINAWNRRYDNVNWERNIWKGWMKKNEL